MTHVETVTVTVHVGGQKVRQSADLCRRSDSANLWLRLNMPDRPPARRSLRTDDLGEARRRAALVIQRLYDQGREWTPAGPGPRGKPTPTIAEFAAAFQAQSDRPSTARNYARSLIKVATLAGLDPAKHRLDRLDEDVVYRYCAAATTTPYSQRTCLLAARSMFGPRHRRWLSQWTIPPSIAGFRRAELPRSRRPDYRPLPDDAMAAIVAASKDLEPRLWRAHLMLRDIGLRSSEAVAARQDWLVQSGGQWFFCLTADEGWQGKNPSALARLPIAADLAAELLAGPGPHVVEGTDNERFDLVKRRHAAWLRQFLPAGPAYEAHRSKPNQALRRQFVERCIRDLGWDIKSAANYTRHDPKTLLDWYAGGQLQAPPSRLSEE